MPVAMRGCPRQNVLTSPTTSSSAAMSTGPISPWSAKSAKITSSSRRCRLEAWLRPVTRGPVPLRLQHPPLPSSAKCALYHLDQCGDVGIGHRLAGHAHPVDERAGDDVHEEPDPVRWLA